MNSTAATPEDMPWPLTDGAAAPAGSMRTQFARVARHRWLVLAITLIATLGATGYSALQGSTYTGTTALTVASGSGNPGSDAAVAQGYVEYFTQVFVNSPKALSPGPAGADLSARTSAASSIIYISAATPDPRLAKLSAATTAQTFRDVVNAGLKENVDRTVADLTKRLDDVKKSFGSEPPSQSGLVSAQIDSLQNEIIQVQSSGSRNQLQDLNLDPIVSSSTPHLALNAGLGLVGGLILGVVIALVLGSIEDRLITSEDVRRRLGLDVLASITGRTAGVRAVQMRRLAAVVDLASATQPATLAVTSVGRTPTSGRVASSIAAVRAQQGQRTLLITADHDPYRRPEDADRPDLDEFLAERNLSRPRPRPSLKLPQLFVPGVDPGMHVLPAGTPADPYRLFRSDRLDELVKLAGEFADVVIIAAPPCAEDAVAYSVCAATDRTILVLERGAVRARDAVEVCSALKWVHATVWGAVIADARMSEDPDARRMSEDSDARMSEDPIVLGSADSQMAGTAQLGPNVMLDENRSNGTQPPKPAEEASARG